MQDKIRSIQRDEKLTQSEKNSLISQLLQTENKKIKVQKIEIKKCSHYKRNCMIIAKCCKMKYECRLCHDDYSDHKINRFETELIVCKICDTEQIVSNQCSKCLIQFGNYFCIKCKLWTDTENVSHCDDCGICIKGVKDDLIHCHKCNICYFKNNTREHECLKFLEDCPVCFDTLHHSTKDIHLLKCKHVIHKECLMGIVDNRCPMCKKSIYKIDTDLYDHLIETQPMPEEYKKDVKIKCNDCSADSIISFHFLGNKCSHCSSYNTCLN